MKSTLVFLLIFIQSVTASEHIRDICENAYYATGYVKLHEYKVSVDWSRLSDHGLEEFESIIYGDHFKYLGERDLSNGKTIYTITEVSDSDSSVYQVELSALQRLTFNGVDCRYAL